MKFNAESDLLIFPGLWMQTASHRKVLLPDIILLASTGEKVDSVAAPSIEKGKRMGGVFHHDLSLNPVIGIACASSEADNTLHYIALYHLQK